METLEVLFKNIKFSIENEKYGLKKVDKDLIIINLQFLCGYTTEEMNLKIKRATLQFDKTLNNLEETITKINRDFKRVINSPDIVLWTINEKNPESFFDSKDKWKKYPKEIKIKKEIESKKIKGEKKLTGWYRDIPKI